MREAWYVMGKCHRLTGPAVTLYYEDGTKKEERWITNGKLHRVDGPTSTLYCPNGTIDREYGAAKRDM